MTELSVRRTGDTERPLAETEWDPLRWTRALFRWDPFRPMAPMLRAEEGFGAAFDVKENKEGYLFKADVPGIKEKDVEVTITGNRLTVHGHRESEKEEKNDAYYMCERSYGSFTRTFTLPDAADMNKVHAELKDGVLTVFLPRRAESQPKKIEVKAAK